MSLRLSVLFSTCAAALLTPALSAGATVERECAGPSIHADASFREQYPELVDRLRSELPQARVDACAVVDLRLTGANIAVSVALPDGRTAARDVSRHEDVLPTLQALLLIPEPGPEPVTVTAAPAPQPVVAVAPTPAPRDTVRDAGPVGATRSYGFELSLISGVRVGDGQFGYGAGVLSFIELQRWLVGFQGRADGYRALRGRDPETALSLGLLLGRRFSLAQRTLDFTVGPAMAIRGASFSSTEVSVQASSGAMTRPPEPPPSEPDIGPTPRLLLGARLGFSPHSLFRTFIGVDGELGPTRSADASADAGASGRMPVYTVGLALGATVGTR